LTKWRNGYSIKTKNFRITRWKKSENFEYELYDHRNDKKELKNLVNDPSYSVLLDSLKIELDIRIADSKLKPSGVGRQFKQQSYRRAPNLTQGDLYNKNGERVYFKTAD
jgi:ribosomal protein RSM22 (predicted rRNA methylase)